MRNPHLKLHSRAEFTNPTRKQNTHSTPIPHKIKPKGQSPKDNSTCARNAPPTSPNAENLPISPSTGPSTPKAPQAPVHVSPKLPKAQSTQARRVHVIPCSPCRARRTDCRHSAPRLQFSGHEVCVQRVYNTRWDGAVALGRRYGM